jgi:hypothetical protein
VITVDGTCRRRCSARGDNANGGADETFFVDLA